MTDTNRKRLGWTLAGLFIIAMLMATGPGVLLVNRPTQVFGAPLLYAWAILWYFVEAGVVVAAYLLVWRTPAEAQSIKTRSS